MSSPSPSELSQWFDAYAPVLVLYARQWLDAARAEEIVQDGFLRLMLQGRSPDNPKAWLFTVVRTAAADERRRYFRQLKHTHRAGTDRPLWFYSQPGDLLDATTAQQALAALPDEQREVIVLRIWAGMTLQEISTITNQPVSTLFSRYKAGLAELRKRMELPCGKKND